MSSPVIYYHRWITHALFESIPSAYALGLIPSHPIKDIMLIVSVPKALLPTFHSPLSHSHKPTRVLIFLLSSIKWTKNLWPTFPSTYCPISLQLNSLIVICRFPLIFPFTLCIEPTLVKFLPILLHQTCSCQGHQVTSCRSFQWSIISPHLPWRAAFYGIDHSLLFDVLLASRIPQSLSFPPTFLAISSQSLPNLMSSL